MIQQIVAAQFSTGVRLRGSQYFRRGLVDIEAGDSTFVSAIVSGTSDYKVSIDIDGNLLLVRCTCEYYASSGPCKHIWATILKADTKGYLNSPVPHARLRVTAAEEEEEFFEDADGDDFFDEPPWATGQEGQLPTRDEATSWKNAFLSTRDNTEVFDWPSKRRIIYEIDGAATQSARALTLLVKAQDLKKNGEWGKPRSLGLQQKDIIRLPEETDREILAILAGSRQAYGSQVSYIYYEAESVIASSYRILGPLHLMILPKIILTGRCWMLTNRDSSQLLRWDSGEPWTFSVRITPDSRQNKGYMLQGLLRRHDEVMDLAAPALLLQGGLLVHSGTACRLDDADAFPWIVQLREKHEIRVPSHQIHDFLKQFLPEKKRLQVEVPEEFHFEEVRTAPLPLLSFNKPGSTEKLVARLAFVYSPSLILKQEDQGAGQYDPESQIYHIRDQVLETSAIEKLKELGLRYIRPGYSREPAGWELQWARLPGIVSALIAEGWRVEADGKLFRKPGALTLSVSSGIDWFELHGAVDFDSDLKADLPALLAAMRRGDTMIRLDDGTYGILPEEWLRRYGGIAALGESREDHVRFRASQAGVLDALLAAQPEARFDETFAAIRRRLNSFRGVDSLEPPESFCGVLRPYQKESLGWMEFLREFGFGGCLADDMGLGKTVTILALLEMRLREREQKQEANKPSLIVVPKSLVFNWKLEAARFTPALRILDHTGTTRMKKTEHFEDYEIILTTYGTLRNDAVLFKDVNFDYVILDEAQMIKNAGTDSAKAARLLQGDYRLALSGTPVQNHLGDLWSLFEFLNPGMLGASSVFQMGALGLAEIEDAIPVLRQALRPFILRRTKEQVATELPAKVEQTLFCELPPKQRKLYDELRHHYRISLLHRVETEGLAKSKIQVLEALLRLRQAACHPGLIDPQRIDEPCAKIDMLLPQLLEVLEGGHKALVFSQFTSFLAILKRRLDPESVPYAYLDGQTRNRQAEVERFQSDPECKLFLISLKAGGLGLNLTAGEYVFLLDPWWNPVIEAQAIDRAHRIGQVNKVFACRIISRDTVEEKVLQLQQTKRNLADAIINEDNSLIKDLTQRDLEILLT